MVRARGQGRIHPSQLDEEPGIPQSPLRGKACHRHMQHLVRVDAMQRALPRHRRRRQTRRLRSGRLPAGIPVISLGESMLRPTAMLFRNLASMDVEESIRANPIDGVILLVGCDKTTPAALMGAASCDLPTIAVSGGPMLNGRFRGEQIGSGTDV